MTTALKADFSTHYGDVEAAIMDQGAKLHYDFSSSIRGGEDLNKFCSAPTRTLEVLAFAGRLLRKDPNIELVDRAVIPTDYLPEGSTGRMLLDVLNASHTPVDGGDRPTFTCQMPIDVMACGYAEAGFLTAISRLRKEAVGHRTADRKPGHVTVFVDQEGDPLLVQKSDGERSALSVGEIVINGIPYPAGSLFGIRTLLDYHVTRSDSRHLPQLNHQLSVLPAAMVSHISFKRLSAYGVPVAERGKVFMATTKNQEGDRFTHRGYELTLDEIKEYAVKAVARENARTTLAKNWRQLRFMIRRQAQPIEYQF